MLPVIAICIYVFLSALLSGWMGRKKNIGEGWMFFFCLCFSMLIAVVVAFMSGEAQTKRKSNSTLATVYLVLGSLLFLVFLIMLFSSDYTQGNCIWIITLSIGFFGSALYVSGKNFATE